MTRINFFILTWFQPKNDVLIHDEKVLNDMHLTFLDGCHALLVLKVISLVFEPRGLLLLLLQRQIRADRPQNKAVFARKWQQELGPEINFRNFRETRVSLGCGVGVLCSSWKLFFRLLQYGQLTSQEGDPRLLRFTSCCYKCCYCCCCYSY